MARSIPRAEILRLYHPPRETGVDALDIDAAIHHRFARGDIGIGEGAALDEFHAAALNTAHHDLESILTLE